MEVNVTTPPQLVHLTFLSVSVAQSCKRPAWMEFSFQTVQHAGEAGFVALDDVLLTKGSCKTLNCGFQDPQGAPSFCLWENIPAGDSRDWVQQVRIPFKIQRTELDHLFF